MRDVSVVMESLRLVQRARRRFMELWALEKDVINPMLDRMADDLQQAPAAVDEPPHTTPHTTQDTTDGPAGFNPPAAGDEER